MRAIDTWIFDLDNTLYPAACNLFAQIDDRMGAFISDTLGLDRGEARTLQKQYYYEHGTTLSGLMKHHGVAPDDYLEFVHDIDVSPVPPSPALDAALAELPGRKLVFTNGSVAHADRILDRLGVSAHFEAVFDIAAADFVPKPHPDAYQKFIMRHGIDAEKAVFFEDTAINLRPARDVGMTTVWVRHDGTRHPDTTEHIDHQTDDLLSFLITDVPTLRG